MHSEYQNDHSYLLAFTATVILNYLKFPKSKYFHSKNFDWLTKNTDILAEVVWLTKPKRLFDISILALSL